MNKLLNCKCGEEVELDEMDFHENYYHITCDKCGEYMQPVFTKEKAIIKWNSTVTDNAN